MTFARMTPQQRSVHMAKIRGRDTRPEMVVRAFLKEARIKFETYAEDLPGTPDIVVRAAKLVVFVHGCFWHQHGCRRRKPKTNVAYWEKKFASNIRRDRAAARALRKDGWRVVVAWECVAASKPLKRRLLQMLAPHKRVCHDCSRVVHEGKRFCSLCMERMMKLRLDPAMPRLTTATRRMTLERNKTATKRRWTKLGLCGSCGMPALEGRKTCPEHAKQTRVGGGTRWYHKLAAQGLCRCKAPLEPGHKRCKKCLRKLRREARKRYRRYKDEGRCVFCPKKRYRGSTWCREHRAKVLALQPRYTKAFVARRVAAKRCIVCKRKTKGTQKCSRCTRRDSERAKARSRA